MMKQVTDKDIVQRLKSIEGHVRGIQRMVEQEDYCIDVIHQVGAVQKALQCVSSLILDRHLHTCVLKVIRGDEQEERERILREMITVFDKNWKM